MRAIYLGVAISLCITESDREPANPKIVGSNPYSVQSYDLSFLCREVKLIRKPPGSNVCSFRNNLYQGRIQDFGKGVGGGGVRVTVKY